MQQKNLPAVQPGGDLISFNPEQMQVINAQFFPHGATDQEKAYCFAVAKSFGLNPISKEIFFVQRRAKVNNQWITKVEPMIGRDGYMVVAHRSGSFDGMESGYLLREVPYLDGAEWKIKTDLVAWCNVWIAGKKKPVRVEVEFAEYAQYNDGSLTKFWKEKPKTMLMKVAESQALRKAFNVNGIYSPEEVGIGYEEEGSLVVEAAGTVVADGNASEHTLVKVISEGQIKALRTLMEKTNTTEEDFCKFLQVAKLDELPEEGFNAAKKALDAKAKKLKEGGKATEEGTQGAKPDEAGKEQQEGKKIAATQLKTLRTLIKDSATEEKKFCEFLKVDKLENLPIEGYDAAHDMLQRKIKKNKEDAEKSKAA